MKKFLWYDVKQKSWTHNNHVLFMKMDKDWNVICKNGRYRSVLFCFSFTLKCLLTVFSSRFSNHYFQANPSGTCSFNCFRKFFENVNLGDMKDLMIRKHFFFPHQIDLVVLFNGIVVKSTDSWTRAPRFKSWLCHTVTGGPWSNY